MPSDSGVPSGQSDLTDVERRAIETLRRLAKRWPPTLALWGGLGNLIVIRTHDGALSDADQRVHQVADIAIPAGGGDPEWAFDG